MATRPDKTAADIIDDLRKDIVRMKSLFRKTQTSTVLNYIRAIPKDKIVLTDSVVMGARATIPKDTIALTDSHTANIYSRFELEAVDGLHAQETAIKLGFWQLLVA